MRKSIIDKIDDIKSICRKHEVNMDSFWMDVNNKFSISKAKDAGKREKRSGVEVMLLFQTALSLPIFAAKSIISFFSCQFKKILTHSSCSFYRFLQDERFNWRGALYEFNVQIRKSCSKDHEQSKHPKALIIDDSQLSKVGKLIEGITMVYDHVTRRSVSGYKFLALSYFDGFYARFLDFALVGEKKIQHKRSKKQFNKSRNSKTPAAKRKKELWKDKITLSCELISRAVKRGFIPDYVLSDTWFTCAELINKVRSLARGMIHFLGMIKDGKRNYLYEGRQLKLSELKEIAKQNAKRCSRFNSRYSIIDCILPNTGNVRLFFSRFNGTRKWVALVTTDMNMSYINAIETYSIRWSIEIGFKEMKQLLGLGKCQANDFASQIAHTTCVLIAHAILSDCKYRENLKSLGDLFKGIEQQYMELLTIDKILILFENLLISISEELGGIKTVTVEELLNSEKYSLFKELLKGSLTIGAIFANSTLNTDKQILTNKYKQSAA